MKQKPQIIKKDLIIIGAGLSGLAAGLKLTDEVKEFQDWLIIESRNRVGGRVHSEQHENLDFKIDLGAGWIGDRHNAMYELVERFQIKEKLILQEEKGTNILRVEGQDDQNYKGVIPPFKFKDLIFYQFKKMKLDSYISSINLEDPYLTPNSEELDNITFFQFLDNLMGSNPQMLLLLQKGLETCFGTDFNAMSALHGLWYIRANNNFDYIIENKGGAQQHKLEGGMQTVANKIADYLGKDKIQFDQQVVEIVKIKENQFNIITKNNQFIYECKNIIISAPARINKFIKYSNINLPMVTRVMQENEFVTGSLLKVWAIYKTPFWQNQKFSGQILSPEDLVTVTFDCSQLGYGMMMGFISGNQSIQYLKMSEKDRKQYFVNYLAKSFGEEAKNPIYFKDNSFHSTEFTQGCPVGVLKPGSYKLIHEALQQDKQNDFEQNIHFIGTERTIKYTGYMEGAIQSGYNIIEKLYGLQSKDYDPPKGLFQTIKGWFF